MTCIPSSGGCTNGFETVSVPMMRIAHEHEPLQGTLRPECLGTCFPAAMRANRVKCTHGLVCPDQALCASTISPAKASRAECLQVMQLTDSGSLVI